jgi:hypothetical protein
MASKNSQIIDLDTKLWKDIDEFCKLNEIEDTEKFFYDCFIKGYSIEKNGLLNSSEPEIIEKEIIKEVKVEVPVEVEKIVEKVVEVENTEKIDELLLKIQQLKKDLQKKPKTITKEVEVPVEIIKEVPVEVEKVVEVEVIKRLLKKSKKLLR